MCDTFVLKHSLHDVQHAQLVTILRNIAAAAKRGAKLLVVEHVLGSRACCCSNDDKAMMDVLSLLASAERRQGASA